MLKQILAACLLSLATFATCAGQDGRSEIRGDLINDLDQSAVALHPSTPYLEPSTALLAEIDLSKIRPFVLFAYKKVIDFRHNSPLFDHHHDHRQSSQWSR